jgi:hypothetical protein
MNEQAKWDQFHEFLAEEGGDAATLRQTLKEAGADVDKMERRIAAFLALQKTKPQASWLERARQAQGAFEKKVRAKTGWISDQFKGAGELVAAIQGGKLGLPVQAHAGVYFRNQEDLAQASEEDLKSFIDDCELLGLLEEEQKK